jgi:hypothetical protein
MQVGHYTEKQIENGWQDCPLDLSSMTNGK